MLRERLGTVADLAIIAVAALFAVVLLKTLFPKAERPPDLLKPGDSLAQVDGLTFAAHKKSLLVVLRSECGYCEGSAPFYRELAALAESSPEAVRVVAVFQDEEDEARTFLQENGVKMDVIGGLPLRRLKIGLTPKLVLVDDAGRVIRVWEGLLSRKVEDDVKAVITPQRTRS